MTWESDHQRNHITLWWQSFWLDPSKKRMHPYFPMGFLNSISLNCSWLLLHSLFNQHNGVIKFLGIWFLTIACLVVTIPPEVLPLTKLSLNLLFESSCSTYVLVMRETLILLTTEVLYVFFSSYVSAFDNLFYHFLKTGFVLMNLVR